VKFSSVVSIQIFSVKNVNPSFNEIHVENDYFPLPSKFEMQYNTFPCNTSYEVFQMHQIICLVEFLKENQYCLEYFEKSIEQVNKGRIVFSLYP
jgi:hypothetical protein